MQISLRVGRLQDAASDTLILPVFEEGLAGDGLTAEIDSRLDGALTQGIHARQVSGKLHSISNLLTLGKLAAAHVLVVGAGKEADWSAKTARRVAGTAIRRLRADRQSAATLIWPHSDVESIAAAVHGAQLANFSPGQYKTGNAEEDVQSLEILVSEGDSESLTQVAEKARIIGQASNLARSVANEPGNKLTPAIFAEKARELAEASGLQIEVMEEAEMFEKGYGAILGVSRGSDEPAKLVTMRYNGSESGPTIGLVGKGITFDSGGISIKPAADMHIMKTDMSGAAAVLGTMQAVARLKPRVNVIGVLCLSENLPGPRAVKPGDLLSAGNGKTIEVLNTDAEGRLILADGLVHAREQGATHLVDIATLTGSCVVALGRVNTGVFGSAQEWTDKVLDAAQHAGEGMWQMPLDPDYREQLESDVADIANVGGREGGAITAATFLKEFTGDLPWVHLDIAGTSWQPKGVPYVAKGPTGVAVPTLTRLVESMATNGGSQ